MEGPWSHGLDAFTDTLAIGTASVPEASVEIAVRQFQRLMGVPSCAVAYAEVKTRTQHVVHANGYSADVLDSIEEFLVSPLYRQAKPPVPEVLLWSEYSDFTATPAVTDLLWPAGYREGTSLPLRGVDGDDVGSLHLNLFAEGLSTVQRQGLKELCAFITRALQARRRRDELGLSPREIEVLRLIVDGASNPEIAEELFIARRTVATHVEHLLPKLGVNTRVAAAVAAVRHQLV